MSENLSLRLREFLKGAEGKEVSLDSLRKELRIDPGSPAWDGMRVLMFNLTKEMILKSAGKRDGIYKVVKQVQPVQIFGVKRERHPPVDLFFPKDFETGMEMDFAESIIVREGDLILVGGVSNMGKTALALNLCGENIDKRPVLMGNEYTNPEGEPMPRFLSRLDNMDWVEWADGDGCDKFTLLPVREDYAEHIIKDRINIIDWINIETGEHYMIGTILDGVKRQLGKGIGIICIQKAEGAESGRGGQFTKDFADCELLIDKMGDHETLLTIGKVKEYKKPITGKTYAFGIVNGVKIVNFRPVKKCPNCYGKGYTAKGKCDECNGKRFIDT